MEEQTTNNNWLSEEAKTLKDEAFDGERLPALKLQEKVITELEIDFTKPFESWTSEEGVVKKILPVTYKGEKLVWWLNVKNPVYSAIIRKGSQGVTKFKVLQTGTQKNTRYTLIDEEQSDLPKEVASIQT